MGFRLQSGGGIVWSAVQDEDLQVDRSRSKRVGRHGKVARKFPDGKLGIVNRQH
jgi:hypothetical protein